MERYWKGCPSESIRDSEKLHLTCTLVVRPLGLAHNSETDPCPFRLYEYAPQRVTPKPERAFGRTSWDRQS